MRISQREVRGRANPLRVIARRVSDEAIQSFRAAGWIASQVLAMTE